MNKESKTIILALIAIFVIVILFMTSSPPNSAASFFIVWLFLLIPGLTLAGVVVALVYTKLRRTKITRPHLFGTFATGGIGAVILAIIMAFIATNSLSLDSAIGFMALSLIVIITSVIAGPLVGIIIR